VNNLRKLLTLLLMLLLPLQGMATVVAPLLAFQNKDIGHPSATMPCHDTAAQTTQPSAHHHDTGAPARDTDATSHLCCHQVFSYAPPLVLNTAGAHKFSDVSQFVRPLVTLFIPDSPDRPPRG
jgi:hypothetical protein